MTAPFRRWRSPRGDVGWEGGGRTYKLSLDGHELYLTVVDGPDGGCAHMTVRNSKMGSAMFGALAALTNQVAERLAAGAELLDVCRSLRGMSYEPRGVVVHEGSLSIVSASSPADLVAQVLGCRYLWPGWEDSPAPSPQAAQP